MIGGGQRPSLTWVRVAQRDGEVEWWSHLLWIWEGRDSLGMHELVERK